MTDEHDDRDLGAPLPADVIASLRSGPLPRPGVEDRTVDALARHGLIQQRRRPAYVPLIVGSLAAGLAFMAGLAVGRGGAPLTRPAATTIDVAGHPVKVELAPNEPALMMIRAALDSSIARAPLAGRAVPAPTRTVTWF